MTPVTELLFDQEYVIGLNVHFFLLFTRFFNLFLPGSQFLEVLNASSPWEDEMTTSNISTNVIYRIIR